VFEGFTEIALMNKKHKLTQVMSKKNQIVT
jgi:hypothetical protein